MLWRRVWPALAWVGLAGLCGWLYFESGHSSIRLTGAVERVILRLGPPESTLLLEVDVEPGQAVDRGEQLASFDSSAIDLALAEARLESEREAVARERQFANALARLRSEHRELSLAEIADAAEAAVYAAEIERLDQLLEQRMIPLEGIAQVRAREAALRRRVAAYPAMLEAVADSVALLERIQANGGSPDGGSSSAEAALVEALETRRTAYTLRAPERGVISRILLSPGETADGTNPAIELIATRPRRIVAFVPEGQIGQLVPDMRVEVRAATDPALRFEARFSALSPEVVALPDNASPLPDRFVKGRRAYFIPLDFPETAELVPGSSVVIEGLTARNHP